MYLAFTCCILLDLSCYCSLYKLSLFHFICLFKDALATTLTKQIICFGNW